MPEAPISRTRKFQLFLIDASLTVAGVAAVTGGLWSVYKENAALAATCMAAGLILLFAATLDRFEFLKGFGIEARVKKLDETLDKAEITLQKLRQVGELAGANVVSFASNVGRIDARPSFEDTKALIDEVKVTLQGLGSDREKIRSVLMPWLKSEISDLSLFASKPLFAILVAKSVSNAESGNEFGTAVNDYCTHIRGELAQATATSTPVVLSRLVQTCPLLTSNEREEQMLLLQPFLDEMNYLLKHEEFRDLAFWKKHVTYR